MSGLEDLERLLRARLDAIGPAPRAVLLHVLKPPDHERARRIAKFYDDPMTQTFAKLLFPANAIVSPLPNEHEDSSKSQDREPPEHGASSPPGENHTSPHLRGTYSRFNDPASWEAVRLGQ